MNRRIILSGVIASLLTFGLSLSLFAQKDRGVIHYTNQQGEKVGWYEGSYALLIGISNYTSGWSSLGSVPEEISLVEATLQEQGFQVIKHLDLNAEQLSNAFKDFINDYGYAPNNRLLFFFSGHGYTREHQGYIIPADTPNPTVDEQGFLRRALSMLQIVTWARLIEAKHVLFVFDSCFSGTVFEARGLDDVPPHISQLTAEPVRMFITGGTARQKLPAKSIFTPIFVEALHLGLGDLDQDGYITGMELGFYLQSTVPKYAKHIPQYGKILDPSLDNGDFVFKLPDTRLSSRSPTPTPVYPSLRVEIYASTVISEPAFRINSIEIRNAQDEVIQPVDNIYTVRRGETVTITVEFTNPHNHRIDVYWTTSPLYGEVSIISEEITNNTARNHYTANNSGSDYVRIIVSDKDRGENVEKSIIIRIEDT